MQKISHHFFLRKYTNKNNEQSILWLINIDKRQYKISTGFHVKKELWDKQKQRVKGYSPEAHQLNGDLSTFFSDANSMINRFSVLGKILTIEDFSKIINGLPQSDNLIQFCKDKTAQLDGVLAPATITTYYSKISQLEKFAPETTFGQINQKFLLDLLNCMKEKKNQQNTIHTMYKTLSTLINHAIDDNLIESNPIPAFMKRYKIKSINGKRSWLSPDELSVFEKLFSGEHKSSEKISKSLMKKKTLRWYLFACYTSLRYSDLYKLEYRHIVKNGGEYPSQFKYYISKVAQKNSNSQPKQLLIPLVDQAVNLLPEDLDEKSDERLWRVYPNQKVNEMLKLIAEIAEIKKRLTFHSARHTFAMISLNMDIPIEVIQDLLGHSGLETTKIYAKMLAETKFRHMKAWQSKDEKPMSL